MDPLTALAAIKTGVAVPAETISIGFKGLKPLFNFRQLQSAPINVYEFNHGVISHSLEVI
jgi:hypothetical protein